MEPAAAPAPTPANKYANGKIYKIVSNFSEKIYIGSTCTMLAKRFYHHKASFKQYQKGKADYVSSYDIISLGESEIVLIEEFPCVNKDQLFARERFHIESNKCVNKRIPGLTRVEPAKAKIVKETITPSYIKRASKNYYEKVKHTDAHKSRNLANVLAFRQRQKALNDEVVALMAIELA